MLMGLLLLMIAWRQLKKCDGFGRRERHIDGAGRARTADGRVFGSIRTFDSCRLASIVGVVVCRECRCCSEKRMKDYYG
jgi:hypothetical protein